MMCVNLLFAHKVVIRTLWTA